MNIPDNLKYTKDHEWVRLEGGIAFVGITDFAQRELGDIVYVDIEKNEEEVQAGDIFGSIEAVKTVSDLFSPLTGKIIEVNTKISDQPELINTDSYENGWIIKIQPEELDEMEQLLSPDEYKALIGE